MAPRGFETVLEDKKQLHCGLRRFGCVVHWGRPLVQLKINEDRPGKGSWFSCLLGNESGIQHQVLVS